MSESFERSQLRIAWLSVITLFLSLFVIVSLHQTEYHAMVLNGPYEEIIWYMLDTRGWLIYPMWATSGLLLAIWLIRGHRHGWDYLYSDTAPRRSEPVVSREPWELNAGEQTVIAMFFGLLLSIVAITAVGRFGLWPLGPVHSTAAIAITTLGIGIATFVRT